MTLPGADKPAFEITTSRNFLVCFDENRTFSGLPLDKNLADREADPRCALQVVDLRTGDAPHWVRLGGVLEELYDVVALPGAVPRWPSGSKPTRSAARCGWAN